MSKSVLFLTRLYIFQCDGHFAAEFSRRNLSMVIGEVENEENLCEYWKLSESDATEDLRSDPPFAPPQIVKSTTRRQCGSSSSRSRIITRRTLSRTFCLSTPSLRQCLNLPWRKSKRVLFPIALASHSTDQRCL